MSKLNQKGAVDLMFVGVLVVLVAAAAFTMWRIQAADETVSDTAANTANESTLPSASSEDSSAPADETSMTNDEAQPTEEITLEAVGDYTGSGTATRTTSGTYLHTVMAELGDPAEGDFYEGWIVGPSVVSTGELEKEGEGMWSLVFESEEDYSQHNRVVITEETLANGLDGIPEDHVLEGEF